jgi:hypothetical protein
MLRPSIVPILRRLLPPYRDLTALRARRSPFGGSSTGFLARPCCLPDKQYRGSVFMRRRLRAWKTYSLIDRVQSAKQRRKSRVGIRMARRLAESTKSAAKRDRPAKWSRLDAPEPVLSRAEGSRFLPGPPATGAPTNRSSFVGKGNRGPHEQVFVRGEGQQGPPRTGLRSWGRATGAPTNRSSFVGKGVRGPHEQVFVCGAGQFVAGVVETRESTNPIQPHSGLRRITPLRRTIEIASRNLIADTLH